MVSWTAVSRKRISRLRTFPATTTQQSSSKSLSVTNTNCSLLNVFLLKNKKKLQECNTLSTDLIFLVLFFVENFPRKQSDRAVTDESVGFWEFPFSPSHFQSHNIPVCGIFVRSEEPY